jgi:anti-sigma factor RsiW
MSGHQAAACEEFELLIQADLDGELDAAATAALAGHLRDCAGCAALQRELIGVSARLRREIASTTAPAGLRRALEAKLLPAPVPAPVSAGVPAGVPPPSGFRRWRMPMGSFVAGAAIAACLILLLPGVEPGRNGADASGDAELLAGHIRALQPGHLTDVISTDQHTVKPWFDGRIDYAPPVEDFAAQGFPLVGGRLDYIGGRAVAVLVYRHEKHLIDVFVWPATGGASGGAAVLKGFNILRWNADRMAFRAVSDLDATAMRSFVDLWKKAL